METKHLLYITEVQGTDEQNASEVARVFRRKRLKTLADKPLDDILYTQTEKMSDSVYRFYTYDFYVVEKLSILQRLHHYIRKGYTAALRYVGVKPPVVIIKLKPSFSTIDRATQ